ncbi:sigma-70 family RNA polymerase sigma factor [Klenkia sp. LSe6-5]|uniref:Sigma-70 family RNA polymerase sigma factor n=1 Tax=Klenkia sesuvii TaxID=3103137 RepID=A0ABU8DXJ7_9ACTN
MSDWFEDLYRETQGPVLAYLARRVPPADAADLMAETYLVAWRRRADLRSASEGRPWLFGVARRLLAEHHRLRPDAVALDDVGDPAAPADGTSVDHGPAVRAALRTLGPVGRELVTLTVWDGLSPAEAAAVVGLTAGTARVRLHRARARLARHPQLRDLLEDPAPAESSLAAAAAQPT